MKITRNAFQGSFLIEIVFLVQLSQLFRNQGTRFLGGLKT